MRLSILLLLCLSARVAIADENPALDLAKIEHTLVREPVYKGQPHYALIVFGEQAEHRAWFVIDGDRIAYIDRNGNGDLTDPEDRVPLDVEATKKIHLGGDGAYRAMHVFPLKEVFGHVLTFRLWVPNPNYDISKNPEMTEHHRTYREKKWVNGILVRKAKDKSESLNPLLLTVNPADAQISHFGGPLTFTLAWRERQEVQPWPKKSHLEVNIGCRNRLAKDCTSQRFLFNCLTTTELPTDVHPVATLTYPSSTEGGSPVVQTLQLDQRCCGDRFYASVELPQGLEGAAVSVTMSCPPESGLEIQSADFSIPIQRGVSRKDEVLYVMFRNPEVTLDRVATALRKRGLDVNIGPSGLVISNEKRVVAAVRLVTTRDVQVTADEIGKNTPFAQSLAKCHARCEVLIPNLNEFLKEKLLMEEIEGALQSITGGYVYRSWDKQLIGPK